MVDLVGGTGPVGPPTAFSGLTVAGVPTMGMAGLPLVSGNVYFCDAVNGNDGNVGSADSPLQTLTQAYSLMTDGNNDVAVIVGDGSTAASQRLSSSLTWAKDACHIVGMTAPTAMAQRARITTATGATANLAPLMTISASGCIFANFSFFQGVGEASTDEKLLDITGDRNYFNNVQFGGIGSTAGAARAGSYIISMSGAGENTFDGCVIGLETIQRSAANASVKFASDCQRNLFRNCIFMMSCVTNTTPLHIDASAASCFNGSSNTFRSCLFQHLTGITGSVVPAVVATLNASINGLLVMDQCTTNATKWAAATTQMIISGYAIGNGFSSGRFATAADS
jgi:hypothetical protein